MKLDEVRAIAISLGANPGKPSITGTIRAIQLAEGNFDCFGSADNCECDQVGCRWREDCFIYGGVNCSGEQRH